MTANAHTKTIDSFFITLALILRRIVSLEDRNPGSGSIDKQYDYQSIKVFSWEARKKNSRALFAKTYKNHQA